VSLSDEECITEDGFLRGSATESTCTFCYLRVRAGTRELLKVAEKIHCQFCPANPRTSECRKKIDS
jgi:hypothetical protein